jgi:mannose-6-phosphate isomerase-like protein (cupin superfamily)
VIVQRLSAGVAAPTSPAVVFNELVRSTIDRWVVGTSSGLHFHRGAAEVFVFLDGECDLEVEGEIHRFGPGEAVYIEPDERHDLTAVGDRDLVFFLAVFPNLSPKTTWVHDDGTLEDEA